MLLACYLKPREAYRDIQSDSRRKASILGGENIDHSKKKISYDYIYNSAYLRGEGFLNQRIEEHCEWYSFVSGVG